MKLIGDFGNFTKRLDTEFNADLAEYKDIKDAQMERMKADFEAQKASFFEISEKENVKAAEDVKNEIISENTFKCKQKVENKRDELLKGIFQKAQTGADTFLHSKKYVDFVKANMPDDDNLTIVADSDYYSNSFDQKIKIDEKKMGIVMIGDKIIYDFTLPGMIEAKRDSLRIAVDKVLFGND